jgi:hypothetical protein
MTGFPEPKTPPRKTVAPLFSFYVSTPQANSKFDFWHDLELPGGRYFEQKLKPCLLPSRYSGTYSGGSLSKPQLLALVQKLGTGPWPQQHDL